MRTPFEVALGIGEDDRRVIRFYMDHNRRQAAEAYTNDVLGGGKPVLARAVVEEVVEILR